MKNAAVVVVGLLTSSLAAAIFTWYVNLPRRPRVGYSISTTSIGGSTTSATPDLSIRFRDKPIAGLVTHRIDVYPVDGDYRGPFPLALTFWAPGINQSPDSKRIFGIRVTAPSGLHRGKCEQTSDKEVACTLEPLTQTHDETQRLMSRYSIVVVTGLGFGPPPQLQTTADVELISGDTSRRLRWEFWESLRNFLMLYAFLFIVSEGMSSAWKKWNQRNVS